MLQTVRTTGVFGHIAADRTNRLRTRIGRVVQAVWRSRCRQLHVDDARLHTCAPVRCVEGEDPVHARRRNHHRALQRQRPTRKPGARPTCHEGNALPPQHAQHCSNFFGFRRQHDSTWLHSIRHDPVGVIGQQRPRIRNDGIVAEQCSQLLEQREWQRLRNIDLAFLRSKWHDAPAFSCVLFLFYHPFHPCLWLSPVLAVSLPLPCCPCHSSAPESSCAFPPHFASSHSPVLFQVLEIGIDRGSRIRLQRRTQLFAVDVLCELCVRHVHTAQTRQHPLFAIQSVQTVPVARRLG